MLQFEASPQPELLQWFARGSLKQNLLRAIRLWVWLHSLYGNKQHRLQLNEPFTFADWRNTFFSSTHPRGEKVPSVHDRTCACAKTVEQWLLDPQWKVQEVQWRKTLQQHDEISNQELDELLQQRLFGVTRRSLQTDLHILAELGWLKRENTKYYRVQEFPTLPVSSTLSLHQPQAIPVLNPDLELIAQNLAYPLNGVQRFFMEVVYIVSSEKQERVEDWQEQFKLLWQENPVPPVRLTYHSSRVKRTLHCIVYPVCIYYAQRAVYLCGFGQTPNAQGQWYNYRLDKIIEVEELSWKDLDIPQFLWGSYQKGTLPDPDEIQIEMDGIAWGFDFYLERQVMLLRFDREFSEYYIEGTFRHETFQSISYQQAEDLIINQAGEDKQKLLNLLHSRSENDAYYQVYYRDGDTNVELRLRSWRPRVEVIFPLKLRQKIAQEVKQEAQLYCEK
ncbi:MAG: TIGR03985 family CRISPR-associated protein [Cyanobacteriota bacterium]|nr:TIGR03985 family CRISPR-associated protein [Cyanobacteriota bacterium]